MPEDFLRLLAKCSGLQKSRCTSTPAPTPVSKRVTEGATPPPPLAVGVASALLPAAMTCDVFCGAPPSFFSSQRLSSVPTPSCEVFSNLATLPRRHLSCCGGNSGCSCATRGRGASQAWASPPSAAAAAAGGLSSGRVAPRRAACLGARRPVDGRPRVTPPPPRLGPCVRYRRCLGEAGLGPLWMVVKMIIENFEALKSWLSKTLEPMWVTRGGEGGRAALWPSPGGPPRIMAELGLSLHPHPHPHAVLAATSWSLDHVHRKIPHHARERSNPEHGASWAVDPPAQNGLLRLVAALHNCRPRSAFPTIPCVGDVEGEATCLNVCKSMCATSEPWPFPRSWCAALGVICRNM